MNVNTLLQMINKKQNRTNDSNPNSYSQNNDNNRFLNHLVNEIDNRLVDVSKLFTSLGFNGSESIDLSRLTRPNTISYTLEVLRSFQEIINNSGLVVNDRYILMEDFKNYIIQNLSIIE